MQPVGIVWQPPEMSYWPLGQEVQVVPSVQVVQVLRQLEQTPLVPY